MLNRLTFSFLILLFFFSCQQKKEQNGLLEKKDVDKIVLIGGSLISGMENYGFFERSLIRHFPENAVSLRNIGWPADDVFGLARSQFGSAQNTRSWKPPTAEEGFGSKVLMEHIERANPSTLLIGYGSEAAYSKDEAAFELFTSGYQRLLEFGEKKGIKLILLSPPKQEITFSNATQTKTCNQWLGKTAAFIKEQAIARGHLFVDLYSELISDPNQKELTENGIQLNRLGYEKMNDILLEKLAIKNITSFTLKLNNNAKILSAENCQTSNWIPTINGVSFDMTPDKMLYAGQVISKKPIAIYINGLLYSKNQDTISLINLLQDSLQDERLLTTIKEKNRLHRYRLRPLNEAYIYLFRRHEMGHLAYEMDDLDQLIVEKEREINKLLSSQKYDIEIELIKAWQPPKKYAEDEVPTFVPTPNISEEIAAFNIAKGYEISLFAADPMIANPININWDTKGRAWVATSSTYPHIVPGREPNDKIIILEDTNNDGIADKHTVFAENLLVPHSVMPVPGGAYVASTTQLLFLEDTDGDDVADVRRVVYDGFGNADVHHMIHGLRWTPWGDLHFAQSIYINSFIETAYGRRILNGSGFWKFRPETERLEIYSRGLVNPWGETFDQWGQSFATDGAGSSGISYIFPESAHNTAVGTKKILSGLNRSTPKNTAAEVIYSRHFSKEWQGSIITNDFRANRTVRYKIKPYKSGYQSEEVETVLKSDHRSYRPVDSKIGPDGALYIVDWYNPIIDHGEVDFHHPIRDRTHGRIWKLTKKGSPLVKVPDTKQVAGLNLLNLLKLPEQYTRLQANRSFVEQKGDPKLVINWIGNLAKGSPNYTRNRLEGLWLLTALNHYDERLLLASLGSHNSQEKAAAIRLLSHWKKQDIHLEILAKLINDKHPQVRLEAVHALRELSNLKAAEIAIKVLNHPMDDNLEFALDLTLRNLKAEWLPAFVNNQNVFGGEKNKQLYALLTTEDSEVIAPLTKLLDQPNLNNDLTDKAWLLLAKIGDATARKNVLQRAIKQEDTQLLRAIVNAPLANDAIPPNLKLLEPLLSHNNLDLRLEGLKLASRWKATQYISLISSQIEKTTNQKVKIEAYRALVGMGKLDQIKKLAKSSTDLINRTTACAVWIEEEPAEAAATAVNLLGILDSVKLAELIFKTFTKLEDGPRVLQKALVGKIIPEKIANVGLRVVQNSALNLAELDDLIRTAGSVKPVGTKMTKPEKVQLIQDAIQLGNKYRGSQIYRRKELLCGSCHKIGEFGGKTGPNLSTVGTYMVPNSILESILNPNSDIKQNYETVIITRTDGEIISGLLHRKTNNSTLIRQANNEIVEIPTAEIAETDVSSVSLMPSGLTRNLTRDELKDLLAYLINLGVE